MVYTTPLNPLFAEVFDSIHVAKPLFGRAYAHGSSAPVNSPIRGSVINHRFDFDDAFKNDEFIDSSLLLPTCSPGATMEGQIVTWDDYGLPPER
jgi:hypothetical protein